MDTILGWVALGTVLCALAIPFFASRARARYASDVQALVEQAERVSRSLADVEQKMQLAGRADATGRTKPTSRRIKDPELLKLTAYVQTGAYPITKLHYNPVILGAIEDILEPSQWLGHRHRSTFVRELKRTSPALPSEWGAARPGSKLEIN